MPTDLLLARKLFLPGLILGLILWVFFPYSGTEYADTDSALIQNHWIEAAWYMFTAWAYLFSSAWVIDTVRPKRRGSVAVVVWATLFTFVLLPVILSSLSSATVYEGICLMVVMCPVNILVAGVVFIATYALLDGFTKISRYGQ